MNKIFKTKYDVTTGQTKVVSELANNRQLASSSEGKPKCGGFFGGMLGAFRVLPLALLISVFFSSPSYSGWLWLNNNHGGAQNEADLNAGTQIGADGNDPGKLKSETILLSSYYNRAGKETTLTNIDFNYTVVVGSRAVGGGQYATAVGYKAVAGKNLSTVKATDSHQGTAVGYRTFARGTESTSIGNDNVAWGESSIAIGSDNAVGKYRRPLSKDAWDLFNKHQKDFNNTSEYAALDRSRASNKNEQQLYSEYLQDTRRYSKTHTWARGDAAIAIGSRTIGYGESSTAIGTLSIAKGNYSTAIGAGTLSLGDSSIAIGNESYVYANRSIGIGNEVQAISDGSIVYGLESYAGGTGSVSIGTRAMANVKMSELFNTKAIAYDQDSTFKKLGELDTNKDDNFKPATIYQPGSGESKAQSENSGSIAIGYYVVASGENSLAFGRQAYAKGDRSMAIGPYAYSKGEKSAALGYGSKALGEESLSLGSLSRAEGKNSIALGIKSAVKNENGGSNNRRSGENTIAIGNEAEATMDNSVALGYKSTTKYFYNGTNTDNATLGGTEAITLPSYAPEGTSYKLQTDNAAGIVSVGWKKSESELGLRRIVGVAAGALDSDVATVGQLKALYYVKKEGVVTYYTKEADGKITKLTKDSSKFYKVNTKDGTPLTELEEISADKVFVGPKGANETTREEMKNGKTYSLGDMGNKIKFANILDGNIEQNSDQAITGNQLKNVGDILGLTQPNGDKTKFDTVQFGAVEYVDEKHTAGMRTTFKEALTDTINAINKGYKFNADIVNGSNDTPFYLGSTIQIKAGDINTEFKSKNLKTKFEQDKKDNNSIAKFTIGLSDTPEFTSVKVTATPTDDKHAVNKAYVDSKLQNVAANFTVSGNSGNSYQINKQNTKLTIKGKEESGHKNIETKAYNGNDKKLEISLNSTLKGITSIGKDENNKITFNGGTKIKAAGAELSLTNTGNKVKLSNVADGSGDTDAVNFKQLKNSKLHYLSVKGNGTQTGNNYDNDGAKADGAIAIGVGASAASENSIAMGKNSKIDETISNAVAIGANNKLRVKGGGNQKVDNTVAIGSDNIITGRKVVNLGSGNRIGNTKDSYQTDPKADAVSVRLIGDDNIVDGVWNTVIGEKNKLESSNWTQVMGDYNAVTNSDYAIVMGNQAQATNANKSVVIGASANSTAASAVVIGQGATVETAARDSIALGKGSKATKQEKSDSEYTVSTLKNLKFTSFSGHGTNKSVLSIGDTGKQRLIKHVAPGTISATSTDAINGSQLYSVIDVFGNLGVNVLGAEVDATKGFKQSEFKQLIGKTITASTPATAKTFKKAIDDNIAKINEGFIFGAGDSDEEKGTHYLGDSLIIKAGTITVEDKQTKKTDKFLSDNIRTHYEKGNKNILIGIKENPNFKEVTVSEEVKDTSKDNVLTTKKYVDEKLATKAGSFKVSSDGEQTENITGTLGIKGKEDTANSNHKNISTTASGTNLTIALNSDLKGIASIGKDDKAKISFNSDNTKNEIEFSLGGNTKYKFDENGLDLGSKKLSNIAKGTNDNDATNKSQLNSVVTALGGNAKIGDGGTVTGPTYTLANGNPINKSYNTVGDALKALDGAITKSKTSISELNNGSITLNDGNNGSFVRKNSETKTLTVKGGDIDTTYKGTNLKTKISTNELLIGLSEDPVFKTLKLKNGDTSKEAVFSVDETGNVSLKQGDGNASKITTESDFKSELKGSDEIQVTGTGKLLGSGDTKLSLKNNSIAGTKLKANTITEDKLHADLTNKINRQFKVKAGGKTSENLIGGELEFAAKDSNLTVELDKSNKKISYGLSSTLTGVESIAKDKTKISLADTKIKLMPEEGAALTLTKSDTDKVKISGLGDGQIDGASNEAITGKQLHDLAGKLGVAVSATSKTGFDEPKFAKINGATNGSNPPTTFKGAIDQLITAVNGGLKFAGNTGAEFTSQLGSKITIKGDGTDLTSEAKDEAIIFTLNKAITVSETDEKVVTSKAVAEKLKEYTTTEKLGKDFLKVDGSNIGDKKAKFGGNVGIDKINLADKTEGTSELLQAKALVAYLKGEGEKSVRLSNSSTTLAKGEGAVSIGYNAVSENEGSIALGYNAQAQNSGSVSIGKDSNVTGLDAIALGRKNTVSQQSSIAIGETNVVTGVQTYVMGTNNTVSGRENIVFGSRNEVNSDSNIVFGSGITINDPQITDAIVLGNSSTAEKNAVSVGNDTIKRRIINVADPTKANDAVNKKYVDALTLSYKSNGEDSTKKSINLKTGALDFKKATNNNIQVAVGENGSIQHNLANNLKDVTSISGGKDEQGAKITLTDGKAKKVELNDAKLTGLADGEIAENSKEAVTGKQLADLAGKLGIEVDDKKTAFTAPTFNDFKLKEVNGTDGTVPKNIVEGLQNTVSKLNEGLKFGGDIPSAGTNTNNTHYLGSTINIVRLVTPANTGTTTTQSATTTPAITAYSGENLITQYSNTGGNAKIEIGFKDAPTFSKVTLSEAQTYGNSSNVGDKDLISKSYLDAALKDFKFNVEYGGQKVQIGRGDTLKFNAGLNIKVELAQNGTTQPSAGSSALASGASSSNSGDSTAGGGNGTASVGTSGSLGVASQGAGANGAGTNGGNSTSSTASSGATPSTTTAGTASSTPSTTSNTTAVVTIGTTEDLTGLKSAEFNGESGNTTHITGNEIVLKDQAGNAHTQTATSQIITDNTDPDKEKAVVTTAEGVTMSVVSDDQVLVNDQTAEANVLSNGKHTTEVKAGEVAIKDKAGKDVVSLKVADGEDGQDGKGATLAFAKGTDGKSGTGVIMGLKDLDATADGSSAANKNYVDEKVSDLDSNRPFDFYIQEGDDYTKVVKGRDGKFYDPKDLEGAKYDAKSKKYIAQDGQDVTPESDKVIIRAEPTTAPVGMNNVASGLGLADPETDPVKAKEAQEKATALTKAVEEKVKAIGDKAKELSTTAQKVTDLTLAVSGLEMAMSAMPEGEDKKKLQTQLEENKKQLEKAKEELGKAKTALTEAQTELTEANEAYEKNYEGYEKVADLVKPDSQADLTNVATIADVQAVAKSGMKFKGNDGMEVRTPLSETLAIKGEENASDEKFNSNLTAAGNIKVEMAQDGKGLEVKLSDQLKNMTSFETREINGKKSVLNSNGLKVVDQDSEAVVTAQGTRIMGKGNHAGQSASYTLDGIKLQGKAAEPSLMATHAGLMVSGNNGNIVINGNRGEILIPDVKPDASGFVAVNKNYVDGQNNALRTQIHHADRRLRAGIAGANAAAALASVSMPGKSMVAIAAAGHDGESALAIGYSRISDNGKVMLKLQGNSNSQGKVSGAVSIGYQW